VATPYEWDVLVIEFVWKMPLRRCNSQLMIALNQPNIAYQITTPGAVDLGAQFALHGPDLTGPLFAVGSYFKASIFTGNRINMGGKSFADNLWPDGSQPRYRRIGIPKSPENAAEELPCTFHGGRMLTQQT
jgi:hypothetical protein